MWGHDADRLMIRNPPHFFPQRVWQTAEGRPPFPHFWAVYLDFKGVWGPFSPPKQLNLVLGEIFGGVRASPRPPSPPASTGVVGLETYVRPMTVYPSQKVLPGLWP